MTGASRSIRWPRTALVGDRQRVTVAAIAELELALKVEMGKVQSGI
jgi:hypothetical protein